MDKRVVSNDVGNADQEGTSINFDSQALHDADEAEFQREEDERQNEVCELEASHLICFQAKICLYRCASGPSSFAVTILLMHTL